MKATITPKKLLQEARRLIKAGWTQGKSARLVGENMHYCMSGALTKAHRDMGTDYDRYCVAETALRNAVGPGSGIVGYNDTIGRSKTQVIAKFDAAIKNLK